jgi:prepilin-type N-terminal cleavage/methylation domain-containing protein
MIIAESPETKGTSGHGGCWFTRTIVRSKIIMPIHARQSAPNTLRSVGRRGFTLTEILVALTLIGLAFSSTFWALSAANRSSFVGRLYTGAITAAQNQIDLILSDSPFNPQYGTSKIPPELQTTPQTPATVKVYEDPISGFVVNGTMSTSVANTNTMRNGYNLNIYRATVTITYTYRKRNYSVVMNTLRAPDI